MTQHDSIPVAQPLHYQQPYRASRPGIVTAIGVMSIIVAGLSILTNLSMGAQAMMMLVVAQMGPMVAPPPGGGVVSAPATLPAGQAESTGSRGWPASARQIVLDALVELRPLQPNRLEHLDALLRESGQDLFPFHSDHATRQLVRASVSDHGATAGNEADYFVLGSGRLEVRDAEAVFLPWSGAVASASAGDARDDGETSSDSGPITIRRGGAGAPLPPGANPFAGISAAAATAAMIDALLSAGLAIFLLVSGILVLRNSPRGARLHWIYVGIKVPLVVLTVLAWGWFYGSMFQSIAGAAPGAPNLRAIGIGYAAFFGAISAAYPIGLLFALRSRSVRSFYGEAEQ